MLVEESWFEFESSHKIQLNRCIATTNDRTQFFGEPKILQAPNPIRPPHTHTHTFLQTHSFLSIPSLSHPQVTPTWFLPPPHYFFLFFSSKHVLHTPKKPSNDNNIHYSHRALNYTPLFSDNRKNRQPSMPLSVLPTTHWNGYSHHSFRWFHCSTSTTSTRITISTTFRELPLLPHTTFRRRRCRRQRR